MFLDIVVVCLLIMAFFKGYNKGLVSTLFSFLAIVIGLVIAFKFSALVANWLQTSTNIPTYWLPFLSFIIIVVAIIFIAKISTAIVENIFQVVLLGWFNKLCGIIVYVALYAIVISCFLFFFEKMSLLKLETLNNSVTFNFIQPIAPKVISMVGYILPLINESIHQLERFFEVSKPV